MNETYLSLPERIKKTFPDIDSDIVTNLRATNAEYANLLREVSKIKQNHPFIDRVLEGEGAISLTAEEHAALVRCLCLIRQMEDLERLQVYFRGHTDAYGYLKQIKAIV